jgi:hypothetical protein
VENWVVVLLNVTDFKAEARTMPVEKLLMMPPLQLPRKFSSSKRTRATTTQEQLQQK